MVSIYQALVVTEQLSFRRAAAVLGVRQSAVSHRIRVLEEKLGVSLFERRPRGVRPTLAGACFFDQARLALARLEFAVASAKSAGCGQQGRLAEREAIHRMELRAETFLRACEEVAAPQSPKSVIEQA